MSFGSSALALACTSCLLATGLYAQNSPEVNLESPLIEALVGQKRSEQLAVKNRSRVSKVTSPSDVPDIEREALVILYTALNGDQWVDKTNWLTDEPVSTWEGVTVANDRVTSLILDSNGLTGEIPVAIGQLRAVETIILGTCLVFCREGRVENQIGGRIPAQINLLSDLQFLDLSGNQLGGALPFLGDLRNLESLDLGNFIGGNNLGGRLPPWLANLTALESLRLAYNDFDGNIPPLRRLTNLTSIDLSGNRLSGEIPDLSDLVLLETLTLGTIFGGNELSGRVPVWLGEMTALRNIFLARQTGSDGSGGLSGTVPDLSALVDLRGLSLSGNRLEGEFPGWVTSLPELRQVDVGLTIDGGGGGPVVRFGNAMEGSIPDLSALAKLEVLGLSNNDFGPDIGPIEQIAALELVLADSNNFVDLPDLTGLVNLQAFDVRYNRLTFEDIRPNLGIEGGGVVFLYDPQQSVPLDNDVDGLITLSVEVGGNEVTTSYRWFRNDQELLFASGPSIEVPDNVDDDGLYRVEASDSDVPELMLATEPTPLRRSLVVNSPESGPRDPDAAPGVCDTGNKLPGTDVAECTLAAAIEAANQLGGGGDITFEQTLQIPVGADRPLPPIRRRLTIDGSPVRSTLASAALERPDYGLRIETRAVSIRNLNIAGFRSGIHVAPGGRATIEDNLLHENGTGVLVESSFNRVEDNTIYGNTVGIHIRRVDDEVEGNAIVGNNLTDDPGSAGTEFNFTGIVVERALRTKIERNRLAASNRSIKVSGGRETKINGNWIGLNDQLNAPIGDVGGVDLDDDFSTEMSFNTLAGLKGNAVLLRNSTDPRLLNNKIGTNPNGTLTVPNVGTGIQFTNGFGTALIRSNTISSSRIGLFISALTPVRVTVENNRIGTDAAGNCDAAADNNPCPFRNLESGVNIFDVNGTSSVHLVTNIIGWNGRNGLKAWHSNGTVVAEKNDIIENQAAGLLVDQMGGNFFGFDNSMLDNKREGIRVTRSGYVRLEDNKIGLVGSGNEGHGISVSETAAIEIVKNVIDANGGDGILLVGVQRAEIRNNKIRFNKGAGIFDESDPANARALIAMNEVSGNQGTATGIHFVGGAATIVGNLVSGDAGDGVALDVAGLATVSRNNIFSNGGLGLHNLNAFSTIAAAGNWWGDASGPSGDGPGAGDGVSAGVDFSDWLDVPATLVLAAPADTVVVPSGGGDTLLVFVQNWSVGDDLIDVSVSETDGWYSGPSIITVGLVDSLGEGFEVPLTVPAAPGDAESVITFSAASHTDATQTTEASVVILSRARSLSRLAVGPDSVLVVPGDSVRFAATGYDQFDDQFDPSVTWSSTGGSISSDGLFVAGASEGLFFVTARDIASGIDATATVEVNGSVAIEEIGDVPSTFELLQNYPNPFNPSTTIAYRLPYASEVAIEVIDMLGRRVMTVDRGLEVAGSHTVSVEGGGLASGVYIYVLRAGRLVQARKMVLLR